MGHTQRAKGVAIERTSSEAESPAPSITRTQLLRSSIALVEDLRSQGVHRRRSPEDYSSAFQVCLPYRGVFVWHVGGDDVVGDPNQVLYVREGEAFRISQPSVREYAELIITPGRSWLDSIGQRTLSSHPLLLRRSRRADVRLQFRLAGLLHGVTRRLGQLELEETVLDLLRSAFNPEHTTAGPIAPNQRLTRRAKEFLEAHSAEPVRLDDIALAVAVSPAYLTDLFRRHEGVPLHRYLNQLRLARALAEIPRADDLTTLALELGFSSHSHFSAAFRRAFGSTPSTFRKSMRRRRVGSGLL